jgi:hypothetical protein
LVRAPTAGEVEMARSISSLIEQTEMSCKGPSLLLAILYAFVYSEFPDMRQNLTPAAYCFGTQPGMLLHPNKQTNRLSPAPPAAKRKYILAEFQVLTAVVAKCNLFWYTKDISSSE